MSEEKKYKIVITGGGTGGHIFPLLAIVRELKNILPTSRLDILYVGPKDSISKDYMEKEGIPVKYISAGKIRRYGGVKPFFHNITDVLFRIPWGVLQSFICLYFFSPDIVLSKGGYGSFPVVISARVFQVPVILHESDSVSGAVNKFLQKFCAEVFTSFPKTEGIDESKMFIAGNPVRKEIIGTDREVAKKELNLQGEKPVIFIVGGSQGSQRINDLFLSASTGFLENFEIIHQVGTENLKNVSMEIKATIAKKELLARYHIFPFLNENQLKNAYGACDLVISRAGAGSIFEIAACKRAGIFLPLSESAQDHQLKNAYIYASSRAGVVLEEENLSSHFFLSKVRELFSPIEQIRNMEKRAGEFARPRAGYIIATYIKEYLTRED